jgi:hypothetical protein
MLLLTDIGGVMATITFSVELICELTGDFMNFDYDYETYEDMTREELEALADDLVMGRDAELYNEIMANISIVPVVENVSADE